MAESSVPFLPIPRFVEVHDDNNASPGSNEIGSALSLGDGEHGHLSSARVEPTIAAFTHQRNASNESKPINMQPYSPTRIDPSFMSDLAVVHHGNFAVPTTIWTSSV